MTFENTAWAIDGALLGSALARRAEFAAVSGAQGIVLKGDLKVTQLAVPGVGLLIDPGVGLVTNKYQDTPNETYVVSNPDSHTITAGEMPAASGSDRSFILAVVVGDPEFSQSGHPWMGSDDPPLGEEQTFNYIRPTLIEVADNTITSLDVTYPALPLARIDIPASTTTITNAMIHDLRALARPRFSQEVFISPAETWTSADPRYIPAGSAFNNWGSAEFSPSVKVPEWASRAILTASINGVRYKDTTVNISGRVRAKVGTLVGPETVFDYEVEAASARRDNLMCAGEFDVSELAGTTVDLKVQGFQDSPVSPSDNQQLRLQQGSQMIFDIRFFEE